MDSAARQQYLRRLGHLFNSSSNWSILSSDMKLHMRLLFTSSTGASPHAPMHSPSFRVNFPSAVVSLKPIPSFFLDMGYCSLAPDKAHGKIRANGNLVFAQRLQDCTYCRMSPLHRPRSAAFQDNRRQNPSVSVASQPFSSCAMASADITADCF